jgi:signal transduction protein with GAF and PtsI domain
MGGGGKEEEADFKETFLKIPLLSPEKLMFVCVVQNRGGM